MRKLILLCLVILVTGCAYTPARLDPKTGTFGGVDAFSGSDIKVNKPLAGIGDLPFNYLRCHSTFRIWGQGDPNTAFCGFIKDGLQKIGFPKPVSEAELAKLVVRTGLTGEIQNLNNVLALNRLSHYVGPFVVAEFRLHPIGPFDFLIEAVIVDPVQGEPVFVVSRQARSWFSVDREFLYPMLNAVKEWFEESSKLPAPERVKPPSPADT